MPDQAATVRMRLVRGDEAPPTPDGAAFTFGLQDSKGTMVPPAKGADGRLRFDFELKVAPGPDGQPVFTGPFASGSREDRFVYLSWRRRDGSYINRIKARLKDLDWPLIRQAQAEGRPLEADMSGRKPGGGTVAVAWRLGDD